MYFDRNNATLVATPDDLTALARCLGARSADGEPAAVPEDQQDWESVGVTRGGRIDPTVAGIVEVMNRPCRSVALERFDGRQADVIFVAWDRAGRATIASGAGDEQLAITATQFNLLPALLTQAVRLHPESASATRPAMTTTAATIERAIHGDPGTAAVNGDEVPPVDDLISVLGSLRHAWRASGSWHGKTTDLAMTVIFAGDEGLWTVRHDAARPGSQPTPETTVRLDPSSPAEITSLLGDVVTGRSGARVPLTV